jgi:hypothetical protein
MAVVVAPAVNHVQAALAAVKQPLTQSRIKQVNWRNKLNRPYVQGNGPYRIADALF